MTTLFGKLFFADWRNKGVALLFAVGIWYLAYQSEKRSVVMKFRVKFRPAHSESSVEFFKIVGVKAPEDGEFSLAEGGERSIEVVIVGPRKQIDKLEGEEPPVFVVPVDPGPGQQIHVLEQEDFEYPRGDLTISKISPLTIHLLQEPVRERIISGLGDKIAVTEFDHSSSKEATEVLRPSSGELKIRGPESVVGKVSVGLSVPMGYGSGPVEREIDPVVFPANDPVIEQTVEFWDELRERWVPAKQPPKVLVRVQIEVNQESFPCEGVRVFFQLPLTVVGCKVTLRDVPPNSDSIPVEFRGPKVQIERLRAQKFQPGGITLGVPLPLGFNRDKSESYTFTEDSLVLHGFPDVQVLQHESRREERRAFWTYDVKVVTEKEGGGG